jgi:hypothetical protein
MMHGIRCDLAIVAIICVVFGTPSHAEVLELEGTVKSIDREARTVSIVRKTSKGEKVLDLEVAKNAGDLSSIEDGDEVAISYDSGLELIASIAEKNTSTPTTDADLTPDEQKLVGDWKSKNGKEGKSFDATRVIREWRGDGNEFNRGVWIVRKDGSFLAAFRNEWSIEGSLVDDNTIEFTVFNPEHKVIEKLRMNRVETEKALADSTAVPGAYDIEWTEPSGNKGTTRYEFKEDGTFVRAGKPSGKWELADGVIQVRFDDASRGFAIVRLRSPDGLEGTHTKGDGTKSKWKGSKAK